MPAKRKQNTEAKPIAVSKGANKKKKNRVRANPKAADRRRLIDARTKTLLKYAGLGHMRNKAKGLTYRNKIAVYLSAVYGKTFDEGSYWYENPHENKFFAEVLRMASPAPNTAAKATRSHDCTEADAANAFVKKGRTFEVHEPTLKRLGCTKEVLKRFFSQCPGAEPPGTQVIVVPPLESKKATAKKPAAKKLDEEEEEKKMTLDPAAAVMTELMPNTLADVTKEEEEKMMKDVDFAFALHSASASASAFTAVAAAPEEFPADLVTSDDETIAEDDDDDDDDDSLCGAYTALPTTDDYRGVPAAMEGELDEELGLGSQLMKTGASQDLDDFSFMEDFIASQPNKEENVAIAEAAAASAAAREIVQQDIERINKICTLSKQLDMFSSELADAVAHSAHAEVSSHVKALQQLLDEQFQQANMQLQQTSSQLEFLVGDAASA